MAHRLLKASLAIFLGLATMLSPGKSYTDDILKGLRGPKNWQVDERVSWFRNDKDTETTTNSLILKYWDGDRSGKWGFISLPYKSIESQEGSNSGLGDVSVGFGPRFSGDNLHCLSYVALTFPTGDSGEEVSLGNGRLDTKLGILTTYLSPKKTFEIDASLEYNFTGENKQGDDPANEVSGGCVSGGKITNEVGFATGLIGLINENSDYSISSRTILRYTASPGLHFEFVGDIGIRAEELIRGNGVGFFVRCNF